MTLLLSTLWAQAARDWNPPSGNQYPSHAVVYATLFDASGQEVDNVADMRVGAFIDGECRAAANPVFRQTPDGGRYIYTLRIGVNDADKGKKVQFVLHDPSENEYVLPETITVTGGDETVGGVPSNPFHLTFTPITAINGPSELHVNMGETVKLREKFSFEPEGASLPEVLPWVKDTCSSFTIVNDVLTPVRTGSWAYFDLSISGCWHRTELFIHQPITGLAINDTDYPGGVITVPVNGDGMLNRALKNILIVRPTNATEKVKWTPSDSTAIVDTQGGWWNPVKPGTYTMTATAPGVDPVTVTVKIIQPVERMTPNYDEIRLRVGDELTQYLPYTYTIYPENATDKEAGISYGISSEDGILQRNDDGTIKAVNSGSTTVWVYHKDIPNGPISLSVYVIDFPSKESLAVKNDPFSVTLADYELSQKVDIYQRLVDNIENTGTIDFPYEFDFAEDTAGEGILMLYTDGDDKVNEVSAEQYGSTAVKWTYNRTAMGFNEDGSFNADKEYNFSVGFKLNIVVGLADVWLDRLQMGVNVLHAVGKLVIVLFHLGGDQQFLPQSFALFLCELGKGMEVGFVVFHDGLVNEHVLNLGRKLIALVYQEYQRFEEVFLLPEILVILFLCHLERVHGDGLLFGVRDVCALVVAADTLVGISRIDHDHIGLLLQQLADDTVHVEALAASARPDAEEVGVVGHLDLAFLAGDVDADR